MVLYQKKIVIPEEIHSENLITFNAEYHMKLEELKQHVSSHEKTGHMIVFSTQRITQHGLEISDKKMFVMLVKENGFYATEHHDDDNALPTFFRYDNILGEIPCLRIHKDINFFDVSDKFPQIADQYKEVYDALSSHTEGGIELEYQYAPGTTFAGTHFSILGNLIKVNRSNIEYHHVRTWGGELIPLNGTDKTYSLVDLVPHRENDRFIAPDRILKKITLHDVCFQINVGDQQHFNYAGLSNERIYTLEELLVR